MMDTVRSENRKNKQATEDNAWHAYAVSIQNLALVVQDLIDEYESVPYPAPEDAVPGFSVSVETIETLRGAMSRYEHASVLLENVGKGEKDFQHGN